MPIHILPDDVINKIAAGEVVERPASVVKELVENAIDAGTDSIEVTYTEGGVGSIRVKDNGSGIEKDQLGLVFQRHATSKVNSIDDLEKIGTMGFRGEALASIAAVSRITLKTRTKAEDFGTELTISFGKEGEIHQTGVPIGTEITVADLFAELPARRKFLKTIQTESAHIDGVMTGFALAYPQVGFQVKRDSNTILDAPKAVSVQERLLALWDSNTIDKLHEVFYEHPHVTVRGFVGTPQLSGSSAVQWLFVNRRQVEDRAIFAAVREGYSGLLPPKGKPFFVLYIETPPHLVDVNVHPRKKEVRFASSQFVFQAVKEGVKAALQKVDLTPMISTSGPEENRSFPEKINTRSSGPSASQRYVPDQRGMILNDAAFTSVPSTPLPWEEKSSLNFRFHVLDNVFVFVFGSDTVTVYDQHALHERVLYEEFLRTYREGIEKSERQILLIPQNLKLSPDQFAQYESNKEVLGKLGFSITGKSDRTLEITAVPAFLKDVTISSLLPDVLDEWREATVETPGQDIKIATMACRAAVKAGDPLSEREIQKLLEQISILDEKYTCPHGRPFKVIVTRSEIDKWFKRTGF